ncbi:PKD domain-containing protein [Chitinophaga silvatica]|uniref:PKD domain-containing protein n=1 Tax=Chitinophaga silvatica TaxID=2282649 RepID=A0A3E1YHW1_9BACT|nr:PQQ-dependent sugar dehydrogenase [Chitinophaga silvatica]RFS26961.1 PKD domain-containing protein [Chitinophaga silvatica]
MREQLKKVKLAYSACFIVSLTFINPCSNAMGTASTEKLAAPDLSTGVLSTNYLLHRKRSVDTTLKPEDNRFTKTILSNDLNEPMELAVTNSGGVYFIERNGKLYYFNPLTNQTKIVYTFPVLPDTKEGFGNGLLGVTIDPNFDKNRYIYCFYTPNKLPAAQRVSRFTMTSNEVLDPKSEKVLITIPLELEVSAHTGGSLDWDKEGNLFISTGDNTVPFASNGYAPLDRIPGRITFDAERSAGNTNDLRGKILRIHPEPNGTYTIPEGNLFPKGTANTRPEIYTMGCRNPYRISVDPATGIVYWGEVGPDAGRDSDQGPRGYDEINQAKKPGNYGWPYVVGDNKVYPAYDFATKTIGQYYKAEAPVNESPYNTGLKVLPPATKAMIWYPYDKSPEFPELGSGGRCAMAGPVYHYNTTLANKKGFPAYYDKALFIYDWMRNWVFAVRLDEQQNFVGYEPFMESNGDFRRPIDMAFSKDGVMYVLEYGSVYGIDNDDARLVKVTFNSGNRAPVARINTVDTAGTIPYKVSFDSKGSYDFDNDALTYEWTFGDGTKDNSANPTHTYTKPGVHKAILKITDPSGASSRDTVKIYAGNTAPLVKVTTTDNNTFYFDNSPLHYKVTVTDKEDPTINLARLRVGLHYMPKSKNQATKGHQLPTTMPVHPGKIIMEGSDCKACHQIDKPSVGPAFVKVAQRYRTDKKAPTYLANKIIKGGGGVWGEHSMAAHPQLSTDEAGQIVKYILTLADPKTPANLPAQGSIALKDHLAKDKFGNYILSATYTDGGGKAAPLSASGILLLRPLRLEAEDADDVNNISRQSNQLGSIHNQSWFVFKQIDLKGIKQLTYRFSSLNQDAILEVHTNSPDGPKISELQYSATGGWDKFTEQTVAIQNPGGVNDLYFVFKKEQKPNQHLFTLDWVEFKP